MEEIKGYIEHFIYKNESNGYGVCNLVSDGEDITLVGTFRDADVGDTIRAEGEMVSHPMYGEQFKVSHYEIIEPEDAKAMERYLGSGAIKGIGPAMASKIVKKFGEDTFRIIEVEPEKLAEIKGISMRIAMDVAQQMLEKREMRDVMIFLQRYGISNTMSVKIYNTYGGSIYKILQENPYKLAEDIGGIGFKSADDIAARVGINVDSDFRIRSGILYTLSESSMEGHTYLPKDELIDLSVKLLGVDKELVINQLEYLTIDGKIVVKDGKQCYSAHFYNTETACARRLYDLNIKQKEDEKEDEKILANIKRIEKNKNIFLDDLQIKAVMESVKNGILILTGGPGTGKTTTINTIISYYEEEGLDILLAAPTGRAAKRMTETTGYEAKTIHRLLEISGSSTDDKTHDTNQNAKFFRNQDNPLEADAIIIDEMSMVDIHLFHALLKAIVPGMHLIMVGDASQLPSVGAGQVLRDLIECGKFPTIVLEKIFRQAEESDIVMNAHKINAGKMIALDNKSRDFFFLERDDINVIYKHMVLLIRDKLPGYVGAAARDIQVLTPMRKGALGCESLNKVLQECLNSEDSSKKEYQHGDKILREGDKVMQIKNNYQMQWEVIGKYGIAIDSGTGIFNGDMGKIVSIMPVASQLIVEFDEKRRVTYSFNQLDELELAYAITIHKSQGSEYPAIVMPILGGPRMLMNRNLLYTAVTRAKSCVMILGSSAAVENMIMNAEEMKRYTGLKDRINEVYADIPD